MSSIEDTAVPSLPRKTPDDPLTVAFLGPKGTYSHQAAFNQFRDGVKYVQKETIADTFNAVPSEASIALIPAENSIFGPVVESLDLLRLPQVGQEKFIRGEVTLQVQHCLLASGGTKLSDVRHVLSHEQALGQCSTFLKTHLPEAVLMRTPSTAAAAEAILLDDARQNSAAICSEVCTTAYPDLALLEKGIQNEDNNFTKFWIMTDSLARIPALMPNNCHALLRISSTSTQPANLSSMITQLNLVVRHIDRRPSAQGTPFHDVYILGVSRLPQSASRGNTNQEVNSWAEDVSCALERARNLGWEGCCLGFW